MCHCSGSLDFSLVVELSMVIDWQLIEGANVIKVSLPMMNEIQFLPIDCLFESLKSLRILSIDVHFVCQCEIVSWNYHERLAPFALSIRSHVVPAASTIARGCLKDQWIETTTFWQESESAVRQQFVGPLSSAFNLWAQLQRRTLLTMLKIRSIYDKRILMNELTSK